MTKKVYVVPHTHWDREWFFTASKAKVYLLKDLKDVLDYLEQGGVFKYFLLDGQSSLITDYLKWRPQDTERVKQLVQEGKLSLGPWYTQTDQFLPSGESIINNLRLGIKQSDLLGGHLPVAYVPDSFGQESSMPQIYRGFDIKDAVLYRGFCRDTATKSEFIWRGEDGSEVAVFRMACGYFVGGVIDETNLSQLMTQEPFKTIVDDAATNNVLFPNGSDMAPLRFDLPVLLKKLNEANQGKYTFEVASLTDYLEAVKQEQPEFLRLTGEQDSGKDMRVHKSISSSRADLKKLNTKLQNYLSNVMEPVLALGDYYGLPYPAAAVDDIWEKMCQNAAHDSMGNCVSDRVNEDIKARYLTVQEIATSLVEVTLRQLATRIKKQEQPITLTVFNLLPHPRKGVVNKTIYSPSRNFIIQDETGKKVPYEITAVTEVTELIKGATIQLDPGKKIYQPDKVYRLEVNLEFEQVPAFGYQQFYLIPLADKEIELANRQQDSTIENEFYRITVNADGSLAILDKRNQHLYQHQAVIEENGDDGDSYNYSPAKKDLVIYSTSQPHHAQVIHGQLVSKLILDFDFMVPGDLAKRAQGITDTPMPVQLVVTLNKNESAINCVLNIDNTKPKSHRVCIDFAGDIAAKTSIADIQFGTIKRPLVKEKELQDWAQNQANWEEKPIAINTMQSFVALADEQRLLAVAPQGVREYECCGKKHNTIRLTIFRTYGMLGKRDLLYRPGRASGDETVPTPQAQLNQQLSFAFSLITGQTSYENSNLANKVKELETPLQVYEYAEFLNGRLTFPFNPVPRVYEPAFSWLTTTNQLSISTFQKDHERPGYIIRMYNPKFKPIQERITFTKLPQKIEIVDLRGEKIRSLTPVKKQVVLPELAHAKLITVYFEY